MAAATATERADVRPTDPEPIRFRVPRFDRGHGECEVADPVDVAHLSRTPVLGPRNEAGLTERGPSVEAHVRYCMGPGGRGRRDATAS